ncbi:hypothetical protein CBR_g12348 [Chara braunii]|uniref:Uncharacterized protein n=1 Tax=Chara braunii TaxID=69332 RepID=A0A388KRT8_CHABU|nr:hypothetical protein CBR_g12348 [Chara braunii]|eukprot:GBG72780.1 hypothetical protein CBR_g12348 [Chara braunii]
MKVRHDAEEEKERNRKDDEEKAKKEKEEEERRLQDRKEHEAFHREMAVTMNSKLDRVCEVLKESKGKDCDTVEKLHAEVDELRRCRVATASVAPVTVSKVPERELIDQLLHEQEELKKRLASISLTDQRVAAMEGELVGLRKERDGAVVKADAWMNQALQPDNKRGSIVLPTPPSIPRVRRRFSPVQSVFKSPSAALRQATDDLREMSNRHQEEVDALKELRARDLNQAREAEQEAQRLKDALAKKDKVVQPTPRSEFRSKLDDVAAAKGTSARKKVVARTDEQDVTLNNREAFMKDARKSLRRMKMDEVKALCAREGITYSTLDVAKEELVKKRTAQAFGSSSGGSKNDVLTIDEGSEDVAGSGSGGKAADDEAVSS